MVDAKAWRRKGLRAVGHKYQLSTHDGYWTFFYFIWSKNLALKGVLLHEIYGSQNAEDLPMAFMF